MLIPHTYTNIGKLKTIYLYLISSKEQDIKVNLVTF